MGTTSSPHSDIGFNSRLFRGLGVIGGVGYTPKVLRSQIQAIKKDLKDKNAPFGVDLIIPQIGGSARKTNVSSNACS